MGKYVWVVLCFFWGTGTAVWARTQVRADSVIPADKYSHWTAGISIGEPFIFCNLTSFAAHKTYWGISFGGFGGYQINPVVGVTLSVDYGKNKAGAHSYALERKLGPDGTTYYLPALTGTSFADIYSEISFLNVGMQAAFNLNRILFQPPSAQRFTVLLQPAVYMQRFHADVYNRQDQKVTDGTLNGGLSIGLGGDMLLRARIHPYFDLQLSSGIIWTGNNTFDGVDNLSRAKDDYMWLSKVSLVYKINRRRKGEKDNILYAPLHRNISEELAGLLAEAEKREQRERELLARLDILQQSLRDSGGISRIVDTLYMITREDTVSKKASPETQEAWILSLIGKIRAEQPGMIEEVGYDTLVRQVIEAREEYGEYYTDNKGTARDQKYAEKKYAIQIYAMTNPFPVSFFRGTSGIRVVRLREDKLYRYLYVVYDTMEEARAALPAVQEKYWDAFIREFDDDMIQNALILKQPSPFPIRKNKRK